MPRTSFFRLWLAAASALAVASCGGSDSSGRGNDSGQPASPPVATPPPPTVAESIAAMEARGDLPRLDRTASLLGTDGNGNGVRDDLDALIDGTAFAADQKASLRQHAKALQAVLATNTADPAAMDAARLAEARAIRCEYQKFPPAGGISAAKQSETLEAEAFDTKARIDAYLAFSEASDGVVLPSPDGDTCD